MKIRPIGSFFNLSVLSGLKGPAQAKIIKQSVILFWRDEIPDFLFWTTKSKIRNTGISSLYLA